MLDRTVFSLLLLAAVTGALVCIGSLLWALYLAVIRHSGTYIALFFMAGIPLFSGVSSGILSLMARLQLKQGFSFGTGIAAFYSACYLAVICFMGLFAIYAPES
jgi:hypothetical protein